MAVAAVAADEDEDEGLSFRRLEDIDERRREGVVEEEDFTWFVLMEGRPLLKLGLDFFEDFGVLCSLYKGGCESSLEDEGDSGCGGRGRECAVAVLLSRDGAVDDVNATKACGLAAAPPEENFDFD